CILTNQALAGQFAPGSPAHREPRATPRVSLLYCRAMLAEKPLFLRACRGELTERPPLWLMRQAGRYLAQYRAVREQVSFLELCKSPELACEVTLQPIRRFGFDAAILFSDILIPLEAMGCPIVFPEDGGPQLPAPVRSAAEVERLGVPDPVSTMPFVVDAVRKIRSA